jgi:hypothetical protein
MLLDNCLLARMVEITNIITNIKLISYTAQFFPEAIHIYASIWHVAHVERP